MNKIRLIINNDNKKSEKQKFFIKKELQCILNLYAKMVSNGSWKDYSFSTGAKEVSFDVYQRASEKPVLRITKNLKPNYFNEKYLIKDKDGKVIKKSESLNFLIDRTSWNRLKLIK
tara:strand:- start:876 stop:1223 length:348 start_codon:yes stop_codon:yes gene_type:complete